jgi:predicted metal-dependent hydrolase
VGEGGLGTGIALFNSGHPWEAHEAWEEIWTQDRHGPDSGFWKGLIQVAAGCVHFGRRNRRGTVNKWRGGLRLLQPYRPEHLGVELNSLCSAVEAGLAAFEASPHVWPEGVVLPRIRQV